MKVTTIGLVLVKDVFQVHSVTADGTVVFNRSIRRRQLLKFFETLGNSFVEPIKASVSNKRRDQRPLSVDLLCKSSDGQKKMQERTDQPRDQKIFFAKQTPSTKKKLPDADAAN